MATATEPMPAAGIEPEIHPVDFTADQFFRRIDAGLFAPERRVFLWSGRIYEKMAKSPPHAITAYIFEEALRSRLPAGWLILNENPIRLDPHHVPLPDLAVVRGPIGRYRGPLERRRAEDRYPEVPEVGLIAEIAVASLPKDLGGPGTEVHPSVGPVVLGRRRIRGAGRRAPRAAGGRGRRRSCRHPPAWAPG